MAVRIITDSGSDILPGEMEGLIVLPLTIAFGNDVYHDGVDLSHERFFELLVESSENPTTGQVPPFRYSQAFDEVWQRATRPWSSPYHRAFREHGRAPAPRQPSIPTRFMLSIASM